MHVGLRLVPPGIWQPCPEPKSLSPGKQCRFGSVGNGGFDELMIIPRVEVISDLPAPDARSHLRVRYGQHASLAVVAEVSDNSIITVGVKGS